MILIDCPTCRRQVPEKARTCPGCGKALKKLEVNWTQRRFLTDLLVLVSATSFIAVLVWMFFQAIFP